MNIMSSPIQTANYKEKVSCLIYFMMPRKGIDHQFIDGNSEINVLEWSLMFYQYINICSIKLMYKSIMNRHFLYKETIIIALRRQLHTLIPQKTSRKSPSFARTRFIWFQRYTKRVIQASVIRKGYFCVWC